MPKYSNQDLMSIYPVDPRSETGATSLSSGMRDEIDMRQEFLNTIYGSGSEVAKGMPILVRRLRRDPLTWEKTPCPCRDDLTKEPDLDTICPYCLGSGYYWDEEWWSCYKMSVGSETSLARRRSYKESGYIPSVSYRFYFPYDVGLLEGDTLIEVLLDEEGKIDHPPRRTYEWTPNFTDVNRLDNGRIEYYMVSCQWSNAILIDNVTQSLIGNP